ncbi:hypothetical protein [Flavobacterium sp.]|uniref:hypothetical protein n=1 Tax=Flavobacterium sp. TaxID=239 RepID=UPI00374D5CC1
MKFRQLDFQKFDDKGNYALNEEYIFSCWLSDGWTDRLLSFNIFIDIYYECHGEICFYNRQKNENPKIERELRFETPVEIKILIDRLISQDELQLKSHYSDFFLEDSNNCTL